MTPPEIHTRLGELRALLPPDGIICASIWSRQHGGQRIVAGVQRRNGVWSDPAVADDAAKVRLRAWPAPPDQKDITVEADTWDDAFEKARTAIIAWGVERDLDIVHRMAMKLIDLAGSGRDISPQTMVESGFSLEELDHHIINAAQQAHVIVRRAGQMNLAQLRLE